MLGLRVCAKTSQTHVQQAYWSLLLAAMLPAQVGYAQTAADIKLKAAEFSVPELRSELRARASLSIAALEPELAGIRSMDLAHELVNREKTIYGGKDSRIDWFQLSDKLKPIADATAAMFITSSITSFGDDYVLPNVSLKSSQNVCDGQSFASQPSGAVCSGFLVAPNIVATAAHCITDSKLPNTTFVFGYRMEGATLPKLLLPKNAVYPASRILRRVRTLFSDYALVELVRPVTGRNPLRIRSSGKIVDGAPVSVMGYPSGLPLKFADGAMVLDNSPAKAFLANLDTFGGNSGSPVFGPDLIVEGVLVRGDADYVPIQNANGQVCRIAYYCPDDECSGELVTRATEFAPFLPAPNAAQASEDQGE